MQDVVVVNGFSVVPLKFSEKSAAAHYLYIKEHDVTSTCKPRNKTIFLLNVPPYATEEALQRVFSKCGQVQDVFIHKNSTPSAPQQDDSEFFPSKETIAGFKVAYVVFKNSKGVENAKKLPYSEPLILSTPDNPVLTGYKKWCKQYADQRYDNGSLQQEIDQYMENYDKRKEEEERLEKAQDGLPDREGWITVGKHSKNKGMSRSEAKQQQVLAKEKKKCKEKELLKFYSFQVRESKKEHIAQLRQKFEEDKQRIAQMKTARKFRPY